MRRTKPPRSRERSKRCRRGVWPRSVAKGRFLMSPLLHLAPRHCHCHFSSGRLDLRRRSQRTFESSSRSGTTASVNQCSEVLSQGSPATSLPAYPVSTTPIAATSTGSAFRAAKAPFPSERVSCAPSISPEPEVPFFTLADRIFWQGINDEVDPLRPFRLGRQSLEVVELIFGSANVRTLLPAERSAASRACPPCMTGRRSR